MKIEVSPSMDLFSHLTYKTNIYCIFRYFLYLFFFFSHVELKGGVCDSGERWKKFIFCKLACTKFTVRLIPTAQFLPPVLSSTSLVHVLNMHKTCSNIIVWIISSHFLSYLQSQSCDQTPVSLFSVDTECIYWFKIAYSTFNDPVYASRGETH